MSPTVTLETSGDKIDEAPGWPEDPSVPRTASISLIRFCDGEASGKSSIIEAPLFIAVVDDAGTWDVAGLGVPLGSNLSAQPLKFEYIGPMK